MAELNYLTQEGLDKLRNELIKLKTEGRQHIAQLIAEARDKGDLSENAEYDAAKEAQRLHEQKITHLEGLLSTARVMDDSKIDFTKVRTLSKVKLKNIDTGAVMHYQLVSESEASIKEGKISVKSPIGKNLLGKEIGDIIKVETPKGEIKIEILELSRP
ncbi:MAG: transcription elongation factor GreA [Solitalea-like symbiont of Acarus siro]